MVSTTNVSSEDGTTITGHEVHLVSYPRGEVRASDFRIVEVELPALCPRQVLVRNTWMSLDPGLRLRLRAKSLEGYWDALPLGTAFTDVMTVGEVVASRAGVSVPGHTVSHGSGWRDYAIVEAGKMAIGGIGTLRRIDTSVAPSQAYLGVLGATGLTAYASMMRVAQFRPGDVVWVSAAAGAVGGLAAQLAKIAGTE